MGDFFEENKRFLVIHFAGALVFLIAWWIVGAMFESDIARNKRARRVADREAKKQLPGGVRIKDKERERAEQRASLEALKSLLERKPAKRFTLDGQPDPDLWYNEVGNGIEEELVDACARRNIEVDSDLGRPGKYPATPRQFAWYLRGLEMVDQVLRLCISAHDNILEEGIARVDGITITPLGKVRGGASARVRPYVIRHGLELTIVGHPTAIAYVVEELSRASASQGGASAPVSYLGKAVVLADARVQSLDSAPGASVRRRGRGPRASRDPLDRGRVQARLKFDAIDIDEAGKPREVKR